jgi:hypothetical protein
MSLTTIVLIVAAVLALPGGLFVAWLVSRPGIRFLGLLGGLIGDALTALGLLYFVNTAHIGIDPVTWFLGGFLACSMGVALGALLVGFLFGGGRSAETSAQEA